LLAAVFQRARQLKLIDRKPEAAIDSTGLEVRHRSRHYAWRAGGNRLIWTSWPKLTVVCHTRTHLWAAAVASQGPSQDSGQFPEAMYQAGTNVRWDRLLADAGYDGELNHRFCHEVLGMRSTVIALNPRNRGRKWPKTPYRRRMKHPPNRQGYGQRWQVESSFSRNKRLLGCCLRARRPESQQRECLLRVLTHNLMILRR
jgi:transposase